RGAEGRSPQLRASGYRGRRYRGRSAPAGDARRQARQTGPHLVGAGGADRPAFLCRAPPARQLRRRGEPVGGTTMGDDVKHTRQETADAWIRMTKAGPGSPVSEDNFWAFEAIYDLVSEDPDEGWLMILHILELDQNTSIMENLSAGPLEDLLAKHGPA